MQWQQLQQSFVVLLVLVLRALAVAAAVPPVTVNTVYVCMSFIQCWCHSSDDTTLHYSGCNLASVYLSELVINYYKK
jgi:hypothetical protein